MRGAGVLSAGQPADFIITQQHTAYRAVQVLFRHQRAANQETIGEAAQLTNLPVGIDPRFADDGDAVRYTRGQLAGAVEIDRQIAQITVIDADHFGFQLHRAIQFFFITGFRQHAHIQAVGDGGKLNVLIIIQN